MKLLLSFLPNIFGLNTFSQCIKKTANNPSFYVHSYLLTVEEKTYDEQSL